MATSAARRVRWGGTIGALVGAAYTVVGLLAISLGGAGQLKGTPLWILVFAYIGGGIIGGVLVGLLFPMRRWTLGAVALGTLAAFPCTLGIASFLTPREFLWPIGVIAALIVALVVGGGMGLVIKNDPPVW